MPTISDIFERHLDSIIPAMEAALGRPLTAEEAKALVIVERDSWSQEGADEVAAVADAKLQRLAAVRGSNAAGKNDDESQRRSLLGRLRFLWAGR